jgi:hypothetical protein
MKGSYQGSGLYSTHTRVISNVPLTQTVLERGKDHETYQNYRSSTGGYSFITAIGSAGCVLGTCGELWGLVHRPLCANPADLKTVQILHHFHHTHRGQTGTYTMLGSFSLPNHPWLLLGRSFNLTPTLLRLQRLWRRAIQTHRCRRLALAMALHPRLGLCSGLGALGEDIIRAISAGEPRQEKCTHWLMSGATA